MLIENIGQTTLINNIVRIKKDSFNLLLILNFSFSIKNPSTAIEVILIPIEYLGIGPKNIKYKIPNKI